MKPIRLELTAFGSYTDKTVINFTELQSNLYLITGETGAGKTTIFDAIMFALYGEASGTGRGDKMMHSDLVSPSIPTEVTLMFLHQNRLYMVNRVMKAQKNRTTGEYTLKTPEATLTEPDGRVLSGARKVSDRCEELIGLNAEQFRKIIMLAQGEFREFLKADTKARAAILGKLFDNSAYKRFQALLSGCRDQLRKEREQFNRDIEAALAYFYTAGMDDEQLGLYTAGHTALTENLKALAEAEAGGLKNLEKERDALHAKLGALNTRMGAAQHENKLLLELQTKQAHLVSLQAQTGEMAEKRRVRDAAEKSYHQVLPAEAIRFGADQAVTDAKTRIAGFTGRLETDLGNLKKAKEASEALEPERKHIKELDTQIQNLTDALPTYREIAKLEADAATADKEAADADQAAQTAGKALEQAKTQQAEVQTELAALEGVDAEAADCGHACEKAAQDLADLKAVETRLKDLAGQETALRREEKTLQTRNEKACDAENRYHACYQRFLAGQSGLLAGQLEQEIMEQGEAACPVCRTVFHRGEIFRFAACQAETPTEEAVNQAKEAADAAEGARQKQKERVDRLSVSLEEKKQQAVQAAAKLLPDCTGWEILNGPGYLTGKIAEFEAAEQAAKKAGEAAGKRVDRRNALKKQEKQLAEKLDQLRGTVDTKKQLGSQKRSDAQAARARAEGKKTGAVSAYPGEAEAKQARTEKTVRRNALQKTVDLAENTLKALQQEYDSTEGGLSTEQRNLPGLEKKAADAAEALAAALTAAGFETLEAAQAARLSAGKVDAEWWLANELEELSAYDNDVQNTAKRIEELTQQTADVHYTDLDALQSSIDALKKQHDDAAAACTACSKRVDNHRRTAQAVAKARGALSGTDAMWRRLDRLADLALGDDGANGKLSFDRYVMGAVFEDILQMANARLDTMSGGQYELVHSMSAARSNAQAGLDIEVLDHLTGKSRKTDSLSGGEGFQASLALALGLSDVVQSRAGGTGIDALFIDEGFGSLDDGVLDKAIDVLKQLTDGNRMVGVISHVGRLEESITSKIFVTKPSGKGSRVQISN